jgi:hypothetical protein
MVIMSAEAAAKRVRMIGSGLVIKKKNERSWPAAPFVRTAAGQSA